MSEPQLRRIADTYDGQPRYEVVVDGVVLGTVYRKSITVERKARGQRYVFSRRDSAPRYWGYDVLGRPGWTRTFDTRRDAVAQVVYDARSS